MTMYTGPFSEYKNDGVRQLPAQYANPQGPNQIKPPRDNGYDDSGLSMPAAPDDVGPRREGQAGPDQDPVNGPEGQRARAAKPVYNTMAPSHMSSEDALHQSIADAFADPDNDGD